MIQRTYEIYAKDVGAYEVIARGYSSIALLLQLFWAIANSTYKYFLLGLPLVFLGFVAEEFSPVGGYILAKYIVLAFFIYYLFRANAWRSRLLVARGFKVIFTTKATSAKVALRKYAEVAK